MGHHLIAGQKVSQLQAVLARRCSSIGELQQHLWRAGWQSGVAQWGILGQGSEFAAIIGGNGGINDDPQASTKSLHDGGFFSLIEQQEEQYDDGDTPRRLGYQSKRRRMQKNRTAGRGSTKHHHNSSDGASDYYIDSLLYVRNQKGGPIMKNDSALAAWSIDAIRIVRYQLYNAGSGKTPLPNYENWPKEKAYFHKDDDEPNGRYNNLQQQQHIERQTSRLGDSMMSMEDAQLFQNHSSNYGHRD